MDNKDIKVAMILDKHFPPDPRVDNQCYALSMKGIKVDLYCLTFGNEPLYEDKGYMNIFRIKVARYFKSISALAYTFPIYHWLMYQKLSVAIDVAQYDVLHIHDIQIARSVFWMTRDNETAVILDLHENRPEIMKYYKHVNTFLGKILIYPSIWKKFEKRYIQKADRTIVITEEAQDYYIKTYGVSDKNFMILPNAVSRRFFEDYERKEEIIKKYNDKFVILYLGNTNERRGMLTVLEAVRLLKDKIPNLLFLCAGKSKRDPYWEQVVKEKEIQDQVELLGWQDFELFPSFVESCDVGLCPLERNIHHDTTLANKLFQYMAFGKPVVVSDCTAQARLVEENECGLVFEAGDEFALKNTIQSLYNNEEVTNQLGRNGYTLLSSNFIWEKISDHLYKQYNSLLHKNNQNERGNK